MSAGQPSARPGTWVVTSGEQDPGTVARLLRALPSWFGIESSNAAYIESARELLTYRAWAPAAEALPAGEPAGLLLARRHFRQAAEIHFMAVDPALHRRGVGGALVRALEADLIADGCELLQVKTLGPSHPDAGYARTRQFYMSLGFIPVEELTGLWGPGNPCLIMIKVIGGPHVRAASRRDPGGSARQ
jgi:ribosomal protein S18 acetylase RimI-like enzyme